MQRKQHVTKCVRHYLCAVLCAEQVCAMAQFNNAWGGREDALLQQKLEQCEVRKDQELCAKTQAPARLRTAPPTMWLYALMCALRIYLSSVCEVTGAIAVKIAADILVPAMPVESLQSCENMPHDVLHIVQYTQKKTLLLSGGQIGAVPPVSGTKHVWC